MERQMQQAPVTHWSSWNAKASDEMSLVQKHRKDFDAYFGKPNERKKKKKNTLEVFSE